MKKKDRSHLKVVKPEETSVAQQNEMSDELKKVYEKIAELNEVPEDCDYLSLMFAKMQFSSLLKTLFSAVNFGFLESKDVFNEPIIKEIDDFTDLLKLKNHETIKLPIRELFVSDDLTSIQIEYVEFPIKDKFLLDTREEYEKEFENQKGSVYAFIPNSKEKDDKYCLLTIEESLKNTPDDEIAKQSKIYEIKIVDFIDKLKPSLSEGIDEGLMRNFLEFIIEETAKIVKEKSAMN